MLQVIEDTLLKHGVRIGERRVRDARRRGQIINPNTCYKVKLTKPLKVYKKVLAIHPVSARNVMGVATLLLPVGTIIIKGHEANGKLRADKAKVLSIEVIASRQQVKKAKSTFDGRFIYTKGQTLRPKEKFNTSYATCGSGIHFLITKAAAENY